jgi:hypothetical protein
MAYLSWLELFFIPIRAQHNPEFIGRYSVHDCLVSKLNPAYVQLKLQGYVICAY